MPSSPQEFFSHQHSFSPEDVADFARITGDNNPIHTQPSVAGSDSKFDKPVVHGMLAASAFSSLFANVFPGPGTVYLKQEFTFRKPVLTGTVYVVEARLLEHLSSRHMARFETIMTNPETGQAHITGTALVMHPTQL